jgi:prephenate dehydrogenase
MTLREHGRFLSSGEHHFMTVGLIGYGRFGRLAARYLAHHSTVLVYDRRQAAIRSRRGRIQKGSLAIVASQPVVVLAVPISSMRLALRSIRKHLRPGALVIDACTVKVQPVRWMRESLPPSVYILGAHPLFGPDSDRRTLRGQRVVLCPVRIPDGLFKHVVGLLRAEGMETIVMTPAHHDRMIAETILVTHYVGRLISYAGLHRWTQSTMSYERLLSVVDVSTSDTLQLLRDIWRYNPYSRRLSASLLRSRRRLRLLLK